MNHIKTTVQKLLIEMKKDNIIDNELFHNMFPLNIKPGCLYFLPKILKTGNPGRPIISDNGAAIEKLSAFVDFHLAKYMENNFIPSFIKHTKQFLNHLQNLSTLPNNNLLVMMDIKSLYTNTLHKAGIEAVKQIMNKHSMNPKLTYWISRCIECILKNNNLGLVASTKSKIVALVETALCIVHADDKMLGIY